MAKSKVYSINGPVVTVKDALEFQMLEMVYVGKQRLLGEVISINKGLTTIQVYEDTTGVAPGEPVEGTGEQISVLLGPGLLTHIFDGIQRPLRTIEKEAGIYIPTGSYVDPLDKEKLWDVKMTVQQGDDLEFGQVYGVIQETHVIEHRLLVPKGVRGKVIDVKADGAYKIDDVIVVVQDTYGNNHELNLYQKWPIKTARPTKKRLMISTPLITGQRVIDTLFPIAKGGTAAVPGGFGTGKTMLQHQLAKWCDADIIVYVGCGERGNEMTQVLEEFSELIDPKTNKPLMDRTVLIANTSNMPVAAREASIYTGVAIAEYYRDMGYDVAVMADSTSRWAEALREISGRLEEMPAEEGFPAYSPSRLSQFYERAGYMQTLNGDRGSVSIIGAVSPQGADFSEPVTQNTKRFVRSFWALDKDLAYARHYAAINWNTSYSEYINDLTKWFDTEVGTSFLLNRDQIMNLLADENKLLEIVKLIGADVLPDDQKLVIEMGKVIRRGFLQQNAFHKDDTFVPLEKQNRMMEVILYLYEKANKYVHEGKSLNVLAETNIFDEIIKMKYDVPNDELHLFERYFDEIDAVIKGIE
ncbi:MAG: V-type ATP synthase subunit A [Acholeplasmataceae bacterium]